MNGKRNRSKSNDLETTEILPNNLKSEKVDQERSPREEETEEVSHIGTYQFSSKLGVVQDFIKRMGYGDFFKGTSPGNQEFSDRWIQLATNDSGFGSKQHEYIKITHYEPQMKYLKDNNIDLTDRSPAVKDMVWSTSVQFGPRTTLIRFVLSENGYTPQMSNKDIITLVQNYKIKNNDKLFKSSSDRVKAGTLERAKAELKSLLTLDNELNIMNIK